MSIPVGAVALAALALALFAPSAARAACSGTPTVTCSDSTTSGGDGFGDGSQTNLTINVQPGASVTGGNDGLHLDSGNTVNNSGTITGNTANGIQANDSLTVNNFSGATITGPNAGIVVNNAGATATILNYGTIRSNGLSAIASDSVNLTNYGLVDGADAGVQTGLFGGTATVTNYGTITGANRGLDLNSAGTVFNYGTISGTNNTGVGVSIATGTVTNYGTISGDGLTGRGISIATSATITNSGTISGTGGNGTGIWVSTNASASITNTGTIQGGGNAGVYGQGDTNTTINNSGKITGFVGVHNDGTTGWTLTNSGTIRGTGGTAINFAAAGGNTLTFLAGSRITGRILLGTSDSVNFVTGKDISSLMTFGTSGGLASLTSTGSTLSISGGAPYVINGDTVAVLDPTALSQTDKTLMFFTSNISSLLGSRFGQFGAAGTPGASAFAAAGASGIADTANAAFANVPALAYAGSTNRQDLVPTTMAYDRATGTTVWSKAFVGRRHQDASEPMLGSNTITYGAALGIDRMFNNNVLLGAFIGAGYGRMNVDSDSQKISTDYIFGGVYGRFDWAWHFLDVAVSGGYLSNSSSRSVFNNLPGTGLETATTSYNGYFISPEIAYGVRVPLAGNAELTPIARLKYVAGHFGGYTETGSSANLTVDSRTVQDLEERFELVLSHLDPVARGWLKTSATLGVLALERVGGTSINTVLLGQNLSFTAAGQNTTGGIYAGLGFDYRTPQAVSLFTALDATVMSDKSTAFTAKGGARATF